MWNTPSSDIHMDGCRCCVLGGCHNVPIQFNLAGMFLKGTGVEISVSKAIGLYDLCGKMGINRAYNAIGEVYKNGKDRPVDYAEALKWFELGQSTTNYKSKWRHIWTRDMFCSQHLGCRVSTVPTKACLESRFCNKEV